MNQKPKKQKDYNTVLLEELKHNFGIFGEGLTHIIGKVDKIENDVSQLKDDMLDVKGQLNLIHHELKEKVGRDEFKLLEDRVVRLEKARLTK